MFAQRNRRNLLSKFYTYNNRDSNLIFLCKERKPGFTVGKIYKPFAYTFTGEYYKDFAIFDDFGKVMFMDNYSIDSKIFNVIYSNETNMEFKINNIRNRVDKENLDYKEEVMNLKDWRQ